MDREEREVSYRCAALQALIVTGSTRPVSGDPKGNAIVTPAGELLCHQVYALARKMIEVEKAEAQVTN